jgi:hypothetical protein
VKYEPGEYCTVLYRLGERLVVGTLRWPDTGQEVPETARIIHPLRMRVYTFDQDPALPGLRVVLDPQALAQTLSSALPECRSGAYRLLRCRATALRYRPSKRCSLRLDVWLRDARTGDFVSRTLFAKVYQRLDKAASVYREMQMLYEAAPARDGRVRFAEPVAFLPDLRVVVQGAVDGMPLEPYLSGLGKGLAHPDLRVWEGVVRSASALAAVHVAGLTTDRERPIAAELRRFVKRAAQAVTADPVVGQPLARLAGALPKWYDELGQRHAEVSLIHGDCKPSQFLITADGAGILDFDHCGMADPASDVGTYLATLRQLGVRQSLKAGNGAAAQTLKEWLRALEDCFLDEYCAASNRSGDLRLRAAWYEAVALMRKALRSFSRSPRSPLVGALVEEAWSCLAALPEPEYEVRGSKLEVQTPGSTTLD